MIAWMDMNELDHIKECVYQAGATTIKRFVVIGMLQYHKNVSL